MKMAAAVTPDGKAISQRFGQGVWMGSPYLFCNFYP